MRLGGRWQPGTHLKHFTMFGCSTFWRILTSLMHACRVALSIMSNISTCIQHDEHNA